MTQALRRAQADGLRQTADGEPTACRANCAVRHRGPCHRLCAQPWPAHQHAPGRASPQECLLCKNELLPGPRIHLRGTPRANQQPEARHFLKGERGRPKREQPADGEAGRAAWRPWPAPLSCGGAAGGGCHTRVSRAELHTGAPGTDQPGTVYVTDTLPPAEPRSQRSPAVDRQREPV